MRILLCEDQVELSEALTEILTISGYEVENAFDGEEALEKVFSICCDLIILDVMMPKKDGIEVLETLREKGNTVPVLMLTAKTQTMDKVKGLNSGADDYLTKPFEMTELLARVKSMTRRQTDYVRKILTIGNLEVNIGTLEMKTEERSIRLASQEIQLLEMLIVNSNTFINTEDIYDKIWKDTDLDISVVNMYIKFIEGKLKSVQANCEIIEDSVNGYRIEVK